MMQAALLFLLGVGVGAYGTLIGAGGGFVLVPLLLLLYPSESPVTITTISLAVVCANAVSGSVAYARLKRIDYQTGRLFALATIPGAVIGVFATALFSRGPFDKLLGALLVVLALWLVFRPAAEAQPARSTSGLTQRTLVDATGTTYRGEARIRVKIGHSGFPTLLVNSESTGSSDSGPVEASRPNPQPGGSSPTGSFLSSGSAQVQPVR